jgi:hypothetical protein
VGLLVPRCVSLWVVVGLLWIVVSRCGSLWVVVAGCGSLRLVVDRCGSLWIVVARLVTKFFFVSVFLMPELLISF